MDNINLMKYCVNSSDEDYDAMQVMYNKYWGGKKMVKRTIDSRIMESIKKYIEKISQYYKVEAIILFGSYAKGTENEDSDIDIAIISSDFSDIIEDGAKLIGLTWKIDTRIEPHPITTEDYEKISNPFIKEVINTGIYVNMI